MLSQENNNKRSTWSGRTYVYDPLSILFHWVIGALLIRQIFFPPEIEGMPFDQRPPMVTFHTGMGLIILALVVLRIVWFLRRGSAPMVENTPLWQYRVAISVHRAFYVLMFLTPLLGFLSTFSAPYEIAPFNLFYLNSEAHAPTFLFELPSFIHKQGSRIMIGLLVIHSLAALYHQFHVKDNLLRRMIPALPPQEDD